MTAANIVLIGYALFLFLGAFMGFKAGSKVSLIMGMVSGALVLLGVYLISLNPRNGFLFLTVFNGVLSGVFLVRLLKTQSFMPSGMLFIISLAVFVFCLIRFVKI